MIEWTDCSRSPESAVDETYVKVKGRWMYLYRAVDSRGQTIKLFALGQARC